LQSWNEHPHERARIAVLGLPSDENSSFLRGAAQAPPLIRQAFCSHSANLYAENGLNLGEPGLLADAGDLAPGPDGSVYPQITQAVDRILSAGSAPLCLGGDHAVTYPIVKAVAAHYPGLTILHFDAHPDLYADFEGNPRSHASPFARIMEDGLAKRLVQVGIRTANEHQRQQAARYHVEMIEMKDWHPDALPPLPGPVYLSFDMDCLDPAFAPGVSHLEPGGFSTRQALAMIQQVKAPVVAADLVEFNPTAEARLTAMTAAKIFKELAALMLRSQQ
jgi:agmatinase